MLCCNLGSRHRVWHLETSSGWISITATSQALFTKDWVVTLKWVASIWTYAFYLFQLQNNRKKYIWHWHSLRLVTSVWRSSAFKKLTGKHWFAAHRWLAVDVCSGQHVKYADFTFKSNKSFLTKINLVKRNISWKIAVFKYKIEIAIKIIWRNKAIKSGKILPLG